MVARQQVRRMLLGGVMGLAALAFMAIPPASARSSMTVRTISFSAPLVALGVDQATGLAVVALVCSGSQVAPDRQYACAKLY
jgi:hypothetical protein